MYSTWGPICDHPKPQELASPPLVGTEIESPILRSTALPCGVGLGIGLLGPFSLPENKQRPIIDSDSDSTDMLTYPLPEEECDKTAYFLAVDNVNVTSPPTKKRKMAIY